MLVTPSHWSDEIFILELFIVIFSFGLICRMLYLPPTPIEFHRVKSHNRSLVGGSRFINCDGYRKSLGHSGDRRFQTLTTLVGTELKALFHLAHLRNQSKSLGNFGQQNVGLLGIVHVAHCLPHHHALHFVPAFLNSSFAIAKAMTMFIVFNTMIKFWWHHHPGLPHPNIMACL